MKRILAIFAILFAISAPAYAGSGAMGCFQTPENDTIFDQKTGFNKQAVREGLYAAAENPAQELMMCAAAVATQPLAKSNCRCMERIFELCGFGFNKKGIFYKVKGGAQLGWCLAFPLALWHKL